MSGTTGTFDRRGQRTRASAPVVLLAEDDAAYRSAATVLLRSLGYEVAIAMNGAEAIRHVTKATPDVIVLDLSMPVIDGWQVLRHVRAQPAKPRPYVVVVSAFDDARSRQLAFEAGCDQYLVKTAPLALEQLLQTYFDKRGDLQE